MRHGAYATGSSGRLPPPVEAATNFNESRYYNWFDPGVGMGGWVRMGNRPNEGYAEMTVCCYLPDGRAVPNYKRPKIDGHEAHDAGDALDVVASTRASPLIRRQGVRARSSARWSIRRVRSTRTRTRSAPSISRSRPSADRGAASPNGKRARSSPTSIRRCSLAVTEQHMSITGKSWSAKSGSTSPTRRPARPLVGTALLAEHLVVPLAHQNLAQARPRSRSRVRRKTLTHTAPAASLRRRPLRRQPVGDRARLRPHIRR